MTKLFDTLSAEIDTCLSDIEHGFSKLGDILLRARKAGMEIEEYEALERKLTSRGLKKGDLYAMQAIAKGNLDKRLFFCGVSHTLLMSLPMAVQEQLFTSLEFELRTGADTFIKKTWLAMTDLERTQLLGKGKKIHKWVEQDLPGESTKHQITWNFATAKYEDAEVLLAGGTQTGKISRQSIALTLHKKNALEKFISDLQADLAALSKPVKKAA